MSKMTLREIKARSRERDERVLRQWVENHPKAPGAKWPWSDAHDFYLVLARSRKVGYVFNFMPTMRRLGYASNNFVTGLAPLPVDYDLLLSLPGAGS